MRSLSLLVLAAAYVSALDLGTITPPPNDFTLQDADDSGLLGQAFEVIQFFVKQQSQTTSLGQRQGDRDANFNLDINALQNKHDMRQFASGINPGSPQDIAQDQKFNDFIARLQYEHQEKNTHAATALVSRQDKAWAKQISRQGIKLLDMIKHEAKEVAKEQKKLMFIEAEENEVRRKAYQYQNKYMEALTVYNATPAPPRQIRTVAKKRYLKYLRLFDRANEVAMALDNKEELLKGQITHEQKEIAFLLLLATQGSGAPPVISEGDADPDEPGVPSDDPSEEELW